MTRKLFISDIHGYLAPFCAMLQKVQFDPDHDQLFLLGDYIHGGPDSLATLEYVQQLCARGVIAIRGNHEQSVLDKLAVPAEVVGTDSTWNTENDGSDEDGKERGDGAKCGGDSEKEQLLWALSRNGSMLDFLAELPLYWEDEQFICVHAGIDPDMNDWRQTASIDFLSIRDRFHGAKLRTSKPVIFGHTPCHRLHGSAECWFGHDKIGIDGGIKAGMQLNCLEWTGNGYRTWRVPKNA